MQTNAREDNAFELTAEASILAELTSAPVAEATLKTRVRAKVRGLSDKHYKSVLNALVAARKIHGRPKLGKSGKPTRTMESYALGAPPPPPPPPRELAPSEILKALHGGPLTVAALKQRLDLQVPGLSAKDYKAVLVDLVAASEIHGRHPLKKDGKPSTAIDAYVLGPPPRRKPQEFLKPVLAAWKKMRIEAAAAGVAGEELASALFDELERDGISAARAHHATAPSDDREEVLRGVRALVAREGRGALIPIRQLRGAMHLAKSRFDVALLQLYSDDAVILHHHDYVGSLSEAERAELVVDQHGNYYVGVALRGEP